MAHEEERAVVLHQQFFQQLQRLDVEVVGRLVQHQHVGRPREQARQQQTVALAAGERFDRRTRAFRREQEIAEIADDVFLRAADLDEVRALADGVGQRGVVVELRAQLVEIGHAQLGAQLHGAGVRLLLAQNDLEQCALARAVGAEQTDLVTALDAAGEIIDDLARAERLADMLQFRHQLAGAVARIQTHLHLTLLLAAGSAFAPQLLQAQHAAFVARAPRLYALAYPHFFLRQHLVELGIDHRLVRQHAFLDLLVCREVAGEARQLAAVQFDDARGDVIQETPVVGDQQHAAAETGEQTFQPLDGSEIQVVGRLVEDQYFRLGHQRLRQRHALAHAAGQGADERIRIQLQLVDGGLNARLHRPAVLRFQLGLQRLHLFQQFFVVGIRLAQLVRQMMVSSDDLMQLAQAARHFVEHGGIGIQHRLLAHVADARGRLPPHRTVVQVRLPGQHFEQTGFAAAVAPDQADAFALVELKFHTIQEGDVTKSQSSFIQRDIRHLTFLFFLRQCGLIDERETDGEAAHREITERRGELVQHQMRVIAVDAGGEEMEHEQRTCQDISRQDHPVPEFVTIASRLALRRQCAQEVPGQIHDQQQQQRADDASRYISFYRRHAQHLQQHAPGSRDPAHRQRLRHEEPCGKYIQIRILHHFPFPVNCCKSSMISCECFEVSTFTYTLAILPCGSIRKV